jgi:hypothetical protein
MTSSSVGSYVRVAMRERFDRKLSLMSDRSIDECSMGGEREEEEEKKN